MSLAEAAQYSITIILFLISNMRHFISSEKRIPQNSRESVAKKRKFKNLAHISHLQGRVQTFLTGGRRVKWITDLCRGVMNYVYARICVVTDLIHSFSFFIFFFIVSE